MNIVTLVGRLTKDPEFKDINEGKHVVCRFSLAVERTSKSSDAKKVDFINIEAWDDKAKLCEDNLHKGSLVSIKGSIRVDNYETKEGQKKNITKVKAYEIMLIDQPYSIKEKYFSSNNIFDENSNEKTEEVPF